ncbi:hypothetical protein L195_g055253 [Trifolium pratense]|uniref:Uncharacterized protein n=1 Tax=Trifolium pratense TaxID=57577 RepID=A0A2K3KKD0_TRIPR|nr:hypothetical protein L195_g055253 [Trifolium pratense]
MELVPKTDVVSDVDTSMELENGVVPSGDTSATPETVIDQNVSDISYQMNTIEEKNTTKLMMTGNNSADHSVVNSQFDESMKTVSKNLGDN